MNLIVAWTVPVQGLNSLKFNCTLLLWHVIDPVRYYYAMCWTQHVIIMPCGLPSTLLLCHVVNPACYYYVMWLTQHVIIMTCGWPCTLLLWVLWRVLTKVSCSVGETLYILVIVKSVSFQEPSRHLTSSVHYIYRLFKATTVHQINQPLLGKL